MMSKKELALVFEQLEKEHSFSGAILVSQDGEVLFEKAYGFASRQLNVPNVLETKMVSCSSISDAWWRNTWFSITGETISRAEGKCHSALEL